MTNGICQIEQVRQLSFSELDFLLTTYRTRSISKAAKKHNFSVSVASRLLKRLREILNDPLFVRSNPNLVPTDRMHALYPQIVELVGRADALVGEFTFDPATLDNAR